MPHGGGHAGGGHHGGFSGGGGFHHHHHHHRHHSYGTGGVYVVGGGWGWWGPYRRGRVVHGWIWGSVVVFIIVVAVLSVTLSIRFAGQGDDEKYYTPGDTRIHPFSSFFCSSISVKVPSLPAEDPGHVYYLTETPPLNETHTIQLSNKTFSLTEDSYKYWHFYLYPKSTIAYSGCISIDSLANSYYFYIVKGTKNFNSWKDDPSTSKSVTHYYVTQSCDNSRSNQKSYTVPDGQDDHYYFVYYNDEYSTVRGKQSVNIQRYEYSTPSNYIEECTLTGGAPCSVSVNFQSSNKKVLIMMPLPSNVDWDDTQYRVDISCGPQAIGYVIVTLVPFFAVVMCMVGVVLACYIVRKRKRDSYRPINRNPTAETDVLVDEKPPVYAENPPPYNPSYN